LYKASLVILRTWPPKPRSRPLAEPRRREILLLVRDRPRAVNEIASHFDITHQAVSQHLQVLKEAGLVAVRPEGQRRLYVVRPLESVRGFLAELWPKSLDRLRSEVESRKRRGR
jgi:DNA-binding transcriptional ArsR family regulator